MNGTQCTQSSRLRALFLYLLSATILRMSEKVNTSTLKGFKELLPREQILFNALLDIIRFTYERYGFIPLDTPVLERAEVIRAKAGGETEQQIYEFTKGDTEYAMRFDLTVPLARYVAEHERDLAFPFRRYAIGKVYRGERPQAGRLREFYQCDIDVIGKGELSLDADTELPMIIQDIFTQILPTPFTIRVNNRKTLDSFFVTLGVETNATLRILDKLDKIGEDGVRDEFLAAGLSLEVIEKILAFACIKGTNAEILAQLEAMQVECRDLRYVAERAPVQIDLSIARGLAYYTGTVYETRLNEYPEIGSICSGGRYENLAGAYTTMHLPGVGISIGLSRLFDQLTRLNLLTLERSTPTSVLIIGDGSTLAQELRAMGINTEMALGDDFSKLFKYAHKLGIPYVLIRGEEEMQQNKYSVKDMRTGEQQLLDRDAVVRYVTGA